MTTYVVTRKSDGVEVYRYSYGSMQEFEQWPSATHNQVALVETDPEAPLPYSGSWKIKKIAFRNRFTAAEKVALEIAALDNASASTQARERAATLRAAQLDVLAAEFIDLKKQDIRNRLAALEALGIIAAGRAAVILDTPPTDEEVWNG